MNSIFNRMKFEFFGGFLITLPGFIIVILAIYLDWEKDYTLSLFMVYVFTKIYTVIYVSLFNDKIRKECGLNE